MRYSGIIDNDTVDCDDGLSVGVFFQGCKFHCKNCQNKHTWDLNGGIEIDVYDFSKMVIEKINKNGVMRNLSILGGEPLIEENMESVKILINEVKKIYPTIKIYLWSGYTLQQLKKRKNKTVDWILKNIDYLIDGLYVDELRDITLKLRGSSNQHIYENKNGKMILTE